MEPLIFLSYYYIPLDFYIHISTEWKPFRQPEDYVVALDIVPGEERWWSTILTYRRILKMLKEIHLLQEDLSHLKKGDFGENTT